LSVKTILCLSKDSFIVSFTILALSSFYTKLSIHITMPWSILFFRELDN